MNYIHAQGQQTCLLCHLAVQSDDFVAAAFDRDVSVHAQLPLFRPLRDMLCQKFPCFLCATGSGKSASYVHRVCYRYHQRFFPTTKLRLRDIFAVWPRVQETFPLSTQQKRRRDKETYKQYFAEFVHSKTMDAACDFGKALTLIAKLPNELLCYIAETSWPCALQEPVTVLVEGRIMETFLQVNKNHDMERLTYAGECVDISHLTIFGYSYVTGLSLNRCKEQIYPARHNGRLSIAVVRDEVGILDVDFRGDFKISRNGCWYKLIHTEMSCLSFDIYIKDIVVDIRFAQRESEWISDLYWDQQLVQVPRASDWYTLGEIASNPTLMRYIKVDGAIQGITVACDVRGLLGINAHTHDWTSDFYEDLNEKVPAGVVWIYFPLAKDEAITAGWVRELDNNLTVRHPALVLRTSLQRTCTFGPYVPVASRSQYRFRALGDHSNHPVIGICYNDMGMASSSPFKLGLAYDNNNSRHEGSPLEPPLQGVYSLPHSTIPEWFRSSASLDGATRVRLCIDEKQPHMPTIGMLVGYVDHEESLGQWRYDRAIEEIDLTGAIYVLSGETATGPYVLITSNVGERRESWREITVNDQIVWWFTCACSIVDLESA